MCNRIIKRAIPADLIDAVYKAEGWTRREGEAAVARVKTLYNLTTDARNGRYVATRRECAA